MNDFLKDPKISKYIKQNVGIDFSSVHQFNSILIIKNEKTK